MQAASEQAFAQAPLDMEAVTIPLRLAVMDDEGWPRVVPLWFQLRDGRLYCATHQSAWIVPRLRRQPRVGFDISTNEPPYRGVRGTGIARLVPLGDQPLLQQLIQRYLGDRCPGLANWLLSRRQQELVIEVTPQQVSTWDYSGRMAGEQRAHG